MLIRNADHSTNIPRKKQSALEGTHWCYSPTPRNRKGPSTCIKATITSGQLARTLWGSFTSANDQTSARNVQHETKKWDNRQQANEQTKNDDPENWA